MKTRTINMTQMHTDNLSAISKTQPPVKFSILEYGMLCFMSNTRNKIFYTKSLRVKQVRHKLRILHGGAKI